MEFKIQEKENKQIEQGGYYLDDITGKVYRICYDKDRGYCLLNVEAARIESEFHELIELLIKYTNLGNFKKIEQVDEVEFKIV
ncbi:hypothetical protein [Metabacillus fastidiosus]|uniref:hypothetical protein n=1 Tax=Metabacillus fastidiosus TaxID=1458 RepID=UPI003D2B0EB7